MFHTFSTYDYYPFRIHDYSSLVHSQTWGGGFREELGCNASWNKKEHFLKSSYAFLRKPHTNSIYFSDAHVWFYGEHAVCQYLKALGRWRVNQWHTSELRLRHFDYPVTGNKKYVTLHIFIRRLTLNANSKYLPRFLCVFGWVAPKMSVTIYGQLHLCKV